MLRQTERQPPSNQPTEATQKVIVCLFLTTPQSDMPVFSNAISCTIQRETLNTNWQLYSNTRTRKHARMHTHTHTRLMALCPGLPGWAGTRKVKTIWILLKQETVSGGHQLGHMQVCTSLQTDNHASTPPLKCFTGRMPFLPSNQQRQSTEGS